MTPAGGHPPGRGPPADAGSPPLGEVLRRLEEIVRALESEETDLDRALALFEEGVGVLRAARDRVREAELRVQRVLERAGGELGLNDLDV